MAVNSFTNGIKLINYARLNTANAIADITKYTILTADFN